MLFDLSIYDQVIFTDGACKNNGKANPKAGIGIFFGQNNFKNISQPLDCHLKATNQKAELMAISKAIDLSTGSNIIIITDSKYAYNCLTNWYKHWQQNDWKTANGLPVVNKSIIVSILDQIAFKRSNGGQITISDLTSYGLKSHNKKPNSVNLQLLAIWQGNFEADKLASLACY